MATKRCVRCGEHKKLYEFHENHRNKDGHDSVCRSCRVIISGGGDINSVNRDLFNVFTIKGEKWFFFKTNREEVEGYI